MEMSDSYVNQTSRIPQERLILGEKEEIDTNVLCSICQLIVFKPQECSVCENLFCSECIQSWVSKKDINNNERGCPFDCPKPIKLKIAHKMFRNIINSLKYSCENEKKGCKEILTFEKIYTHQANCLYSEINCTNKQNGCNEKILKKDLEDHVKICECKQIKCEKCDCLFLKKNENNHDCIVFLKKLEQQVKKKLEDYVTFNEKRIVDLYNRINEIESTILIQKAAAKPGRKCPKGHLVTWQKSFIAECPTCLGNNLLSRYCCPACKLEFCVRCIKPLIVNFCCPGGHKLKEVKNLPNHLCDICLAELDDQKSYQDSECDFDICANCIKLLI